MNLPQLRIDILTLFPQMIDAVMQESIIGKAIDQGVVELNSVNFRDYATDKHHTVDDTPYGGGGGMVLKPEPIFAAVEDMCAHTQSAAPRIILMSPQGEPFTQTKAEQLSHEQHLILICGHYEGFDERIREHLVTDSISLGDFVLTGGEIPAMAVADSVIRLLPSVLGNDQSAVKDSFSDGLLEYPQYTRPLEFRGWKVPDILLSGHHQNIEQWRRKEALFRTWKQRPDLLEKINLDEQAQVWLDEFNRRS